MGDVIEAFDAFVREVQAWPRYRRAIADGAIRDEMPELGNYVVRLDERVEEDRRLVDFLDELRRIVQSGELISQRIVRVHQAFIGASRIWPDPQRALS